MMKVQWFDIGFRAGARNAAINALPAWPGVFMLFAEPQPGAWVPLVVGKGTGATGVRGRVAAEGTSHYAYTGGASPALIARYPDHAAFLGAVEAHYGDRTGWLVASFTGEDHAGAETYAKDLRKELKGALAPLWDSEAKWTAALAATLPGRVDDAIAAGADPRSAAVALLDQWAEAHNVAVENDL
jgi:hypothetical protein